MSRVTFVRTYAVAWPGKRKHEGIANGNIMLIQKLVDKQFYIVNGAHSGRYFANIYRRQ